MPSPPPSKDKGTGKYSDISNENDGKDVVVAEEASRKEGSSEEQQPPPPPPPSSSLSRSTDRQGEAKDKDDDDDDAAAASNQETGERNYEFLFEDDSELLRLREETARYSKRIEILKESISRASSMDIDDFDNEVLGSATTGGEQPPPSDAQHEGTGNNNSPTQNRLQSSGPIDLDEISSQEDNDNDDDDDDDDYEDEPQQQQQQDQHQRSELNCASPIDLDEISSQGGNDDDGDDYYEDEPQQKQQQEDQQQRFRSDELNHASGPVDLDDEVCDDDDVFDDEYNEQRPPPRIGGAEGGATSSGGGGGENNNSNDDSNNRGWSALRSVNSVRSVGDSQGAGASSASASAATFATDAAVAPARPPPPPPSSREQQQQQQNNLPRPPPPPPPRGTQQRMARGLSHFGTKMMSRRNLTKQGDPTPSRQQQHPLQQHQAPSQARAALLVDKLATRSRFGGGGTAGGAAGGSSHNDGDSSHRSLGGGIGIVGGFGVGVGGGGAVARRYKPGDKVLVCNHHQGRLANLVNRCGFPPGEGSTPEEQRGPYIYVLAAVRTVHFEEFAAYYTVTRADTGADQRADADFMEPIRTARGEAAATRAAAMRAPSGDPGGIAGADGALNSDGRSGQDPASRCADALYLLVLPVLWLYDCLSFVTVRFLFPLFRSCLHFSRRQARLILYGLHPYVCQTRVTVANFVVLCSAWFMFTDSLRLAVMPPSADRPVAAVNLAVWIVLVLELLFELFIRPDGYRRLIISDKAYAPTTVRYINAFHLVVESAVLLLFIPEFFCLFSSRYECDDRIPFSFQNAALMAVTGPTQLDSFYGKAYFALTRLRIFGMVRHWKNMWIANTFINMKWNKAGGGIMSAIVPRGSSRARVSPDQGGAAAAAAAAAKGGTKKKAELDPAAEEQKKRDAALTNASTIGTALMETNSYRALIILWAITGLFPLLYVVVGNFTNSVALSMTNQLQGTNLVADNNATATCNYLHDSVWAWIVGVTDPDFENDNEDPFLLTLNMAPVRCLTNETDAFVDRGNDRYTSVTMLVCLHSRQLQSQNDKQATELCNKWETAAKSDGTVAGIAHSLGLRTASVVMYEAKEVANKTFVYGEAGGGLSSTTIPASYEVVSSFDQSYSIRTASRSSLLLQLCLLIGVLGGLSVLRRDAEVLVLWPLRRMLKIVAQYAKNPLSPPKLHRSRNAPSNRKNSIRSSDDLESVSDGSSELSQDDDEYGGDQLGLGSYETEQLITAVTKITDLLRKCWGVAGADIISTNLATREGALTEVFNPTVPGKSVYALFAFAAINEFDFALRNLGGDVMILINDVAAVLHGEVFRWGFGDSGQCNKNLGAAFLMVFWIGSVKDVIEKLEQARDVIFSTGNSGKNARQRIGKQQQQQQQQQQKYQRHQQLSTLSSVHSSKGGSVRSSVSQLVNAKKMAASQKRKVHQRSASVKAMSLSLKSLPGISTFTDRAVIGMLKSFAGIYRDRKILNWNNDFRLSAGVGQFKMEMIYGMDAGWAVEGAVGSEYKIDATYLSPHVNMASRMTGACKQYGVSIMLSQAVQELMSNVAKEKLRHLDTVTVKGSSVQQRIYTYDARPRGVDFFLYSRSDEQADVDADRYTPNIWNTDQDLKAMRQHISTEFWKEFENGRKAYLNGDWSAALRRLQRANDIMVETALEEGYLEDEFEKLEFRAGEDARAAAEELKRENGDGPSLCLIHFMKSYGGKAPPGWEGWHPLTRK